MKNLLFVGLSCLAFLSTSCKQQTASDRSAEEMQTLKNELDSLSREKEASDSLILRMDDYLNTIAESLDSIKLAEGILTLKVDEYGKRLPKKRIMENLELLGGVIARQRERIEELEATILASPDSSSQYVALIRHLRGEISQKEAEIAVLKKEIGVRDSHIQTLKEMNLQLVDENLDQASVIEEQTKILDVQDEMVNKGYVLMATKKELKAKGLLSWSKLQYDKIRNELFTEVDMRVFREITISSTNVKILTAVPSDSYKLVRSGKVTVLEILDPARFWSLSNYLIIQKD